MAMTRGARWFRSGIFGDEIEAEEYDHSDVDYSDDESEPKEIGDEVDFEGGDDAGVVPSEDEAESKETHAGEGDSEGGEHADVGPPEEGTDNAEGCEHADVDPPEKEVGKENAAKAMIEAGMTCSKEELQVTEQDALLADAFKNGRKERDRAVLDAGEKDAYADHPKLEHESQKEMADTATADAGVAGPEQRLRLNGREEILHDAVEECHKVVGRSDMESHVKEPAPQGDDLEETTLDGGVAGSKASTEFMEKMSPTVAGEQNPAGIEKWPDLRALSLTKLRRSFMPRFPKKVKTQKKRAALDACHPPTTAAGSVCAMPARCLRDEESDDRMRTGGSVDDPCPDASAVPILEAAVELGQEGERVGDGSYSDKGSARDGDAEKAPVFSNSLVAFAADDMTALSRIAVDEEPIEDPIEFFDPPVRRSEIEWMQTGVAKPSDGSISTPSACSPRSIRRRPSRSLPRLNAPGNDTSGASSTRGVPPMRRQQISSVSGLMRPKHGRALRAYLTARCHPRSDAPSACRDVARERRSSSAGKETQDAHRADETWSGRHDTRMARLHRYLSNRVFSQKDALACQTSPTRSSSTLRPVLSLRTARKSHNRLMHSLNGNGMPAGLARVDVVASSSTEFDSISDTCGDVGTHGCVLTSSMSRGSIDTHLSSLMRSGMEGAGGESSEPDHMVVHLREPEEHLLVVAAPYMMGDMVPPVFHEPAPLLVVVNLWDVRERLRNAFQNSRSLLQDGCLVTVLLCGLERPGVDFTLVRGLTRMFTNEGACVAWCGAEPPSWAEIRRGLMFAGDVDAEAPWIDRHRLALLDGALPAVVDDNGDGPASRLARSGPPLSLANAGSRAKPIMLTRSAVAYDLEVVGIAPFRGLWFSETASVADLRQALLDMTRRGSSWRFVANGTQLNDEDLLANVHPHALRCVPLALGGAPKKEKIVKGAQGQREGAKQPPPFSRKSSVTSSPPAVEPGVPRAAGAASSSNAPAEIALLRGGELGEADDGMPSVSQLWGDRGGEVLSPTAAVLVARSEIEVEVADPAFAAHLGPEHLATVAVPPDGRCLYYCVLAGHDAREWVASHRLTGWAHARSRQQRDEVDAQRIRERFIHHLVASGRYSDADRLGLEGSAGCPTQDDVKYLAEMLSGSIVLQFDGCQAAYGSGPLILYILTTRTVDPQGDGAEHYELIQSWMGRKLEQTLASDVPAVAPSRGSPARKRVRGKSPVPLISVAAASVGAASSDAARASVADAIERVKTVASSPAGAAPVFAASVDAMRGDPTIQPERPEQVRDPTGKPEERRLSPSPLREETMPPPDARPPYFAAPAVPLPDALLQVSDADDDGCEIPTDDVLARIAAFDDAVPDLDDCPKEVKSGQFDILSEVRALWEFVIDKRPHWEDGLKHLTVGALTVYKLRITDVGQREEVLILHVVAGDRYVRAHNGVFFMYIDIGSWDAYQGVVSSECLGRVRVYMQQLEGLFRMLRTRTCKTHMEMITAIDRAVTESGGNAAAALDTFQDAAVLALVVVREQRGSEYRHGGASRGGGHEDTAEGGGAIPPLEAGAEESGLKWHLRQANMIARISASLCASLLHSRIFTYYSEWCDSPDVREAGIVFLDSCMRLLDVPKGNKYTELVTKGPQRNIYLSLSHPLRGEINPDAKKRVDRFYSQTFWRNGAAYQCQLAALCLALRGRNVDRAFWGLGPGGVGQSLFSAHLAAILGRRHAYLDTNIFHTDDELRKQADTMLYTVVMTGQEAVENAAKPLRQDTYKKLVTADPIASRLPYGIVTKLVELVGWKRLELNTLLKFTGITEKNFFSIFRRGWVMEYRAQFIEEDDYLLDPKRHAREGRFPRDHKLREFLRSGPAIAVTIRTLWGFMSKYSPDDCLGFIESYVLRGGDKGLTWASLRLACGLPPAPMPAVRASGAMKTERGAVKMEPPEAALSAPEPYSILQDQTRLMHRYALALVDYMLAEGTDWVTLDSIRRWTPPASSPWGALSQKRRQTELTNLVAQGLFLKKGRRNRRGSDSYFPHLQEPNGLWAVLPMTPANASTEFPEVIDATALSWYLGECATRSENADRHKSVLRNRLSSLMRQRGVKEDDDNKRMDMIQKQLRKLEAQDKAATSLAEALAAVKRTRPERCRAENGREYITITSRYASKLATRGRRYIQNAGAQSLSRTLLHLVCGHTEDFDIACCAFSLLSQLFDRLKARVISQEFEIPTVRRVAQDRAGVCADLGMSEAEGKVLLNAVLNGKHVEHSHPVLDDLARDARILRWWACSLLPEVYAHMSADSERRWPEASTLFYAWTPLEDLILEAWSSFARDQGATHISLHYDGLRLQRGGALDATAFAKGSQECIKASTGFAVDVVLKKHGWVKELIFDRPCVSVNPMSLGDRSTKAACIPLAIARLRPALSGILAERLSQRDTTNMEAESRGCRRYRDWGMLDGTKLCPVTSLSEVARDDFLMHVEGAGVPHCLAVAQTGGELHIFDGDKMVQMSHRDLRGCIEAGLDGRAVAFFALRVPGASTSDGDDADPLLDLLAGAADQAHVEGEHLDDSGDSDSICDTLDHDDGDEDVDPAVDGETLDDAMTNVGHRLYHLMRQEIEAAKALWGSKGRRAKSAGTSTRRISCPICPIRDFDRASRLHHHLCHYHTASRRFCASGVKQLRVAAALYDSDALAERPHAADYLRRSARILRAAFPKVIDGSGRTDIDKRLRLLLSEGGPRYVDADLAAEADHWRRIGNIYVTHGFMEDMYKFALLNEARASRVYLRYSFETTRAGNELASLIPKRASRWWHDLLADIMSSQAVARTHHALLSELVAAEEFTSISVDATVKPCFPLLGQHSYRASASLRAQQARPDSRCKYRVLTVRGRSAAPLLLRPVFSEAVPIIVETLMGNLPPAGRDQIRHIALDDIKANAWSELSSAFTNLEILSLDPTHLVMMYQSAHWRKRTEGSQWLRRAMAKLTKRLPDLNASDFGSVYLGGPVTLTPSEDRLLHQLKTASMSPQRAKQIFRNFTAQQPWRSRYDLLEWMTAFASLYAHEMAVPTSRGRSLQKVFVSMLVPERLEWYLNATRWAYRCDPRHFRLMPTGTCSNEALHAELRVWFRNIQNAHVASLHSRLSMFQHAKLLSHNAAYYRPTLRQEMQTVVLHRVTAARSLWTPTEWVTFCRSQERRGRFRVFGKTAPSLEFRADQRLIRQWKADGGGSRSSLKKRPAGALGMALPSSAELKRTRRTVFTRERVVRVVRPRCPLVS